MRIRINLIFKGLKVCAASIKICINIYKIIRNEMRFLVNNEYVKNVYK